MTTEPGDRSNDGAGADGPAHINKTGYEWPRSRFVIVTAALLVVVLVALVVQGVGLWRRTWWLDRQAVDLGQTLSDRIAALIIDDMERVEEIAETFAADLERGAIDRDSLLERLEQASRAEPHLLGLTVAYAPFAYDDQRRLYAPFFSTETEQVTQIEDYYDYTDEQRRADARWYQKAIQEKTGLWVTGYGPAAETTYVGYSLPFFDTDPETGARTLAGVVNLSLSLDDLNDLLNKRNVGRLGCGILIDGDGLLLAHPDLDAARAGLTLNENAEANGNAALAELAGPMRAGASGARRLVMNLGEMSQAGWFFYQPIPSSGWSLLVGIFENELDRARDELRRREIALALTVLVALSLAAALALRVDRLEEARLWALSLFDSLLMVAVIVFIWGLTDENMPTSATEGPGTHAIRDQRGLEAFLEEQRRRAERLRLPPPSTLPTAIFVRALSFEDANHVRVAGTIWQRYRLGAHDGLTRDVTFPGVAPDPEALDLTETGRRRVGDAEVVSWDFRVLLREHFEYADYPFDHQRVPIKLGHPDRACNVILTPDLGRYQLINTAARPGIFADLVLPGWSIRGSDFSYELTDYNLRFGDGPSRLTDVPVFQFNVITRRRFLTPFVSHIVPLLIVMALLHGVLISSSFNEEKKNKSGFSTFGVLETSGAIFFTIALMHIDLRSGLDLDTITYLESLYITSYGVLLLVAVNALLFTTTDAVPLLEYRDNLVAKLLFWPVALGIVLIVSVARFA